jgi:hypothetical protein
MGVDLLLRETKNVSGGSRIVGVVAAGAVGHVGVVEIVVRRGGSD